MRCQDRMEIEEYKKFWKVPVLQSALKSVPRPCFRMRFLKGTKKTKRIVAVDLTLKESSCFRKANRDRQRLKIWLNIKTSTLIRRSRLTPTTSLVSVQKASKCRIIMPTTYRIKIDIFICWIRIR